LTTTAGTTSRGYRYPGDASATDVPGDLKKLADDVNTDVAAVAADGAVTTAKIAASAVTSAKIADATIVTGDLADGAVTSAKILDGTIVAGDLADGAVTSAKILDGTIATADLADGAVTSAKIADGTIATGDLADSAVTSAKIADGTIVNADVNASAAIDVAKLSGVVASATVGNLLDYASATLDTSTGFWQGSASTLAVNTSDPYAGVGCLEATATGSAQFYVSASKTVQVTPGQPYTLTYAAKSATRNLQVYLTWTNAAGGTVLDQGIPKGACTSWTVFSDTRVAPAGATCVAIHFYAMTAGSAGDTLLLDRIGLWAGAGGLWAPPGTPIANLGTYTDETVGRRIFTWDTANNRWQMTYGDTGWREINALQTAAALTKFPNAVLSVRRVNSSVDVRWFSDTGTVAGAAGTAICSTLTGFRPGVIQGRGIVGSAVNASSGLPSVHGVYSDGAALNIATTADSANNVLASLSYTTNDSWPTALPGNAIGTIPQ